MPDAPRYQTHGALLPGDPLYIRRRADHDLNEGILAGDFCYVLAPRQVGKSSLRARSLVELRSEGIMVATANVQAGTAATSEAQWYEGLIDLLVTSAVGMNPGFTLPFVWGKWWDAERGPFAQRFVKLLKEGFLAPTDCQWVITIDEIDASISLPFTDSFFAAIRLCLDQRPDQPIFRRLSIVLLGAATPTELIKDRSRTPFNIGRRIEMTDFTPAEAEPLAAPLPIAEALKPAVLARVLHWTGGQPHLTQTVCEKLRTLWKEGAAPADADAATSEVDHCVESTYFHGGILGDAHFAYITKRARDFPRARQLLRAYRRARSPEGLPNEERSTVAAELKIAGLVKPDASGTLRVANPIYERVFNDKWIRDTTPISWPVLLGELGMAAAVLTLIVGYFTFIPRPYIEQLQTATNDLPSEAHRKLAAIPGYKKKADELLARFWDRRAAYSEEDVPITILGVTAHGSREAPDFTLIYRLRASEAFPTEARRREAARIVREKLAPLRTTYQVGESVRSVAFSPDGNSVFINGPKTARQLWDTWSGAPKSRGFQYKGNIPPAALSFDGSTVLIGAFADTAPIWGGTPGRPVGAPLRFDDVYYAVAFQVGRNTILTDRNKVTAPLWDEETAFMRNAPPRDWRWSTAVAFGPEGQTYMTVANGGTARLWDVRSGWPTGVPLQHQEAVTTVAFSFDDQQVLTGSADKTARIWNVRSGLPNGPPLQHQDMVLAVAFSFDGNTVLTGCRDRTARLWDARSGQPKGSPLQHDEMVIVVAFSPDGSTVLTKSVYGTIRIWDMQSAQRNGPPLQHWDGVVAVAFSPDGQTVLIVGKDKTIRLWDTQNGQTKGPPLPHQDSVGAVAFSRDGKMVLTGSDDGTARLWDVATIEGRGERVEEEALAGTPAEVLERWLKRTALQFDKDGVTLIPRYPLPDFPKEDAKPKVP